MSDAAGQTQTALFADLADVMGLSRPAGQCFAVIWRAAQSPCADDLVAGLGLARSNISTALKELRAWNLISVARAPGDRKEYFTAPADPWEVLRLMTLARHRLMLTPLLERLVSAEAASGDVRLAALHSVMDEMARAAGVLSGLDGPGFAKRIAGMAATETGKKKKKKH